MQVFQRDLCIANLGPIGNSGTIRSLVASSASSSSKRSYLGLGPDVVIVIVMTAKSKLGHSTIDLFFFFFFPDVYLIGDLSGGTMFCYSNPEYTQLNPAPSKRFF